MKVSSLDRAQQELIQGYLAKAREKARVARDLLAKGEWDDTVSRAYYAAFHAAQAALLTEGQRADTHRGLVTLFGLLPGEDRKVREEMGQVAEQSQRRSRSRRLRRAIVFRRGNGAPRRAGSGRVCGGRQ